MAVAAVAIAHSVGDLNGGTLALLALCGLIGGIGITALGRGGVLVTIGLFALSGLPPAAVAGTATVTHVGTGSLGTGAHLRSRQLRERRARRLALVLIAAAVIGTPLASIHRLNRDGAVAGGLIGGLGRAGVLWAGVRV